MERFREHEKEFKKKKYSKMNLQNAVRLGSEDSDDENGSNDDYDYGSDDDNMNDDGEDEDQDSSKDDNEVEDPLI